MVGSDQRRVCSGFPRAGRNVNIMHAVFVGQGFIDGIKFINFAGYLCPVPAFGKGRSAPIGDGQYKYMLRVAAGKGNGLLQQ